MFNKEMKFILWFDKFNVTDECESAIRIYAVLSGFNIGNFLNSVNSSCFSHLSKTPL